MIKAWQAFLISLGIVTVLGFIKSCFVTEYPLDLVAVGCVVPITIAYLTKRATMHHKSFNSPPKERGDSND